MSRDRAAELKAALSLALYSYGPCWTFSAGKSAGRVWDRYVYVRLNEPEACEIVDTVVRLYASKVVCKDSLTIRMWFFNLKG